MSVRRTIQVEVILEHGRAYALEFEDGSVADLDDAESVAFSDLRREFTRQARRA